MSLNLIVMSAGLLLGTIQSFRLARIRSDLSEIARQIRRLKVCHDSIRLFDKTRTKEVRVIQDAINSWRHERGPSRFTGIGAPVAMAPPLLSPCLGREETMQLLLNDLVSRFAADSAAIISMEASNQWQVLQIHRSFVPGARFRDALLARFEGFFVRGEEAGFGLSDHALERCLAGNLLFFGFDRSFAAAIQTERSFVIWLGFSTEARINTFIQFTDYLNRIEGQLKEYDRVRGLQDQYIFEKRRSAERAQLLAFAAHDMRSPINSMRLSLSTLDEAVFSDDDREIVARLRASCDMLSDIVDDAHDFSQFRAGLLRAEKVQVVCSDLVERVCRSFETNAQKKKLALLKSSPAGLLIRADPRQMTRVLANVVGNAIKYTDSGFVSVTCAVGEGDRVAITVRDSGRGMSDEQLSRVFEPYTRFAGESIDGDGLGLALARVFAQLNDCGLQVQSVQGEGTTVTITVPVGENRQVSIHSRDEVRRCRIVLADDAIDAAVSLARILDKNGFDVQTAASIDETCPLIASFKPDFLITDLSFADGDGEALVRYARQYLEDCHIVIISGRDVSQEHRNLLECARVLYLQKPVNVQSLLIHLQTVRHHFLETSGSSELNAKAVQEVA